MALIREFTALAREGSRAYCFRTIFKIVVPYEENGPPPRRSPATAARRPGGPGHVPFD